MPRALSCLIPFLICGCTFSPVHVFHGRTENLARDGWAEEGTRLVGTSWTSDSDSERVLTLSLADASFHLQHPTPQPGKTLHAHSTNGELRAWLVRYADFDAPPTGPSRDILDLWRPEPLIGELELHWRNNLNFVLRVDVRTAGTNSAGFSGYFETRQERDFEPNLIWVVPAMALRIPEPTLKAPDPSEYTSSGTLTSVDREIDRLMKSRRRHRRVSVKNLDTGRSAEFFNRPTLLDKPGVQFDTFIKSDDAALIAALKSFAAEQRLRIRIIRSGQDPSQSVAEIDIYGDRAKVIDIAKSLLQQVYQVRDATPLELVRIGMD